MYRLKFDRTYIDQGQVECIPLFSLNCEKAHDKVKLTYIIITNPHIIMLV